MKKLFIVLSIVLSLALAGNVLATDECIGNECKDFVLGFGSFDINASSIGGAYDLEGNHYPNGGAFGISGAGGVAKSGASGFILNGLVEGEVSTIGGGLTATETFKKIESIDGGKKLTLGSVSENLLAVTGGTIKVKVDPKFGLGEVDGHMFGIAGQGSLNATYLTDGPKLNATGFTGGIAGQGSVGGFAGGVFAASGPDLDFRCWKIDSKAGAGIGTEIAMSGLSYSESFRSFSEKNGIRTEAMGTQVGAETTVDSYGYNYDWDKGLSYSNSYLYGGWIAGGGAASMTTIGGAKATAVGYYVGSGGLNNSFNGSAIGYTYGSVTTVNGMKGSITQAGAGMSVRSNVTGSMHGDIN